jgi:hypothetical protein
VDGAGNVAITGYFQYTINLGAGVLNCASPGTTDFFAAKYNSGGTPLWTERFGGTSSDYGTALAMGEAGQVVVTGCSTGWQTLVANR